MTREQRPRRHRVVLHSIGLEFALDPFPHLRQGPGLREQFIQVAGRPIQLRLLDREVHRQEPVFHAACACDAHREDPVLPQADEVDGAKVFAVPRHGDDTGIAGQVMQQLRRIGDQHVVRARPRDGSYR